MPPALVGKLVSGRRIQARNSVDNKIITLIGKLTIKHIGVSFGGSFSNFKQGLDNRCKELVVILFAKSRRRWKLYYSAK